MKKWESILEDFVGKGNILALRVEEIDGKYRLHYKEGKKYSYVDWDTREDLDRALIQFGGKNPDTCRGPDDFLIMDGSWNSDSLLELGHIITKIRIKGDRTVRETSYPIDFPENCGEPSLTRRKKVLSSSHVNLKLKDVEAATITRTFKSSDEFDNFSKFILEHESLKSLHWKVDVLGTESKPTTDHCLWKRLVAGDGTKNMVLELIALNGKHYTECVRGDLFNAADDMFYSPCRRVAVTKKKAIEKEICLFAAEDGKVNVDKYEAAV